MQICLVYGKSFSDQALIDRIIEVYNNPDIKDHHPNIYLVKFGLGKLFISLSDPIWSGIEDEISLRGKISMRKDSEGDWWTLHNFIKDCSLPIKDIRCEYKILLVQ